MSRVLLLLCGLGLSAAARAEDWTHWRGPNQNGSAEATGLPDEWSPKTAGKDNLIWKQPYGCRSTPMVMNGRVFIISAKGETPTVPTPAEKLMIGEQVVSFDAKTGEKLHDIQFDVYHTDIVTNRLGWNPLAGDKENDHVYAYTTAGELVCLEGKTLKVVWKRQLTEEFGRVSGYGGRIGGGPIFDSGLVIVGIVNASWGNYAPGANRFMAFDGKTGAIAWIGTTAGTLRGTYYSNPVTAVIGGERLLISGTAVGSCDAFQVRTGKKVWSYPMAAGVINASPVVDGNFVFISHGEENLVGGNTGLGKILCLDASQIVAGKPKLVWEYSRGIRWGLTSMAYSDGKLYVPDDAAKLYCFDAKKGKILWKYSYGTTSRGAPLVADGKLYISETVAKFHILKLKKDGSEPDESDTHTTVFKNAKGSTGFVESNSTPSIGDGVIYLATRDELYCIGTGKGTAPVGKAQMPEPAATPVVAQVAVFPADVSVKAGETVEFKYHLYDAQGQVLSTKGIPPADLQWSLPVPPLPKGATAPPPALDGVLNAEKMSVTVNPKKAAQQGYVGLKINGILAQARVRVAPTIPYKQDFEIPPVGSVPGGWINTQGKFKIVEIEEGGKKNKVLFKVNDNPRPPVARANAYITTPDATSYVIEADLKATVAHGKLPDMGIVNSRYTLLMDGKSDARGLRQVRLVSWEALPRIDVDAEVNWQPNVWYRTKLSAETIDGKGHIKAKVWPKAEAEPEKWTIEFEDPKPNAQGAAALYGYVPNVLDKEPGSEILYDNVVITPLKK